MKIIIPALTQIDCNDLNGVGKATAKRLHSLELYTAWDVLLHFPHSYQDRTTLFSIAEAPLDQAVMVEGTILKTQTLYGRKRSLLCTLADDSGELLLRFFHFNAMQQRYSLHAGARLRCFGEVRSHQHLKQMIHPEYRNVKAGDDFAGESTLTPVYPSTVGISQSTWRAMTAHALTLLEKTEDNSFWLEVCERFEFIPMKQALPLIHYPEKSQSVESERVMNRPSGQAEGWIERQTFAFIELVSHQMAMQQRRQQLATQQAQPLSVTGSFTQVLQSQLPFALTSAQQRAINTIHKELTQSHPMVRLLQGDVGAGKTLVALFALLQACEAGFQAALMVPTELLAQQHFENLSKLCNTLPVRLVCVTGQLSAVEKRDTLAAIAAGDIDILIGTHALFQKDVVCARLALVVIDEQHRFGVEQRMALRDKGCEGAMMPHQLLMTATPIPRTLAMTFYADLACSVLDELPPGRTPVTTVALANTRRDEVIARIRQRCGAGCQAYWVCTLVEESEALAAEAAATTAQQLHSELSELNIALVHGRSKADEKVQIMQAFKRAEIDLLVATTVIEVGVDVPNASLMIIENAERLGLAQLHQLRGRVGRGAQQSHCVLLYQAPLTPLARERLAILRDSCDGFVIAEKDLALRGPGDLLGTRQAGLLQFRFADLARDQYLMPKVLAAGEFCCMEQRSQE